MVTAGDSGQVAAGPDQRLGAGMLQLSSSVSPRPETPGAILLRESHHLRQRRQSSDQIHCIVRGIKEYTDLLDVQKMDNGIWQWKL